eukprot:1622343-Alexandrium_andersonii.AAC.1
MCIRDRVWLGHVARMQIERYPKQAMFGWIKGKLGRQAGVRVMHPMLARDALCRAGIPLTDWFRQAQDRM